MKLKLLIIYEEKNLFSKIFRLIQFIQLNFSVECCIVIFIGAVWCGVVYWKVKI